jgi:hypothetical protein
MNNDKEKIIKLGRYTIDSIYYKILLTPFENIIFDIIAHSEDIKQRYVSNSLFEIYGNITEMTITKMKRNLIQMKLISIISETKKGTIYKVHWDYLYLILNELCEESNQLKRLIIADNFRIKHNLKGLNEKNILKYKNSPFDFEFENDNKKIEDIKEESEVIKAQTIKCKKVTNPEKDLLIIELNINQNKLNDLNISLSDKNTYQNEINRLKNKAKATNKKITFNKNTEKWEITK